MEFGLTLISVAFGALITYVFQWLSEERRTKREIRKEKITIFSQFLKADVLNGPLSRSLHVEHFDYEKFVNNIYPLMLDNYYYYPKKAISNFDDMYNMIKDLEYNDLPQDVSSRKFDEHINNLYWQGIKEVEKEFKKLID